MERLQRSPGAAGSDGIDDKTNGRREGNPWTCRQGYRRIGQLERNTVVKVNSLDLSVLLINKLYMPMAIVTVRKAMMLLFRETAEVIGYDNDKMYNCTVKTWMVENRAIYCKDPARHDWILTVNGAVRIPRVIRLLRCARMPRKEVKFSRKNLLVRDAYRCQYCNAKLTSRSVTMDHILPRSRGGKPSWGNVVCCCLRCNSRKGNQLPSEAGMRLLRQPITPKHHPTLYSKLADTHYREWRFFLKDAVPA